MHNQHLCYWWSFNRHKVQYTNSSQIASPPSLHLTPFNLYFPNPLDIQVLLNVLHFRLLHFRLGGPNRKCYKRKCNNSLAIFDYLLVRFSFPILCCYEIFEYNCLLKMNDQHWCCFMELQENKLQYTNSSQVTDSQSLCHTPSNLFCPNFSVIQVLKYVLQFRLLHFRLGGRNRKCNNRKCNNSLPMFE